MDVRNRYEKERKIARRVGRELRGQVDDIIALLESQPDYGNVPTSFWTAQQAQMQAVIAPLLVEVFTAQVADSADDLRVTVSWNSINQRAADWARRYSFDLVKELTDTSRALLQDSIAAYYERGMTIGDLELMLVSDFGPTRAEMIAVTEVTRSASAAEEELAAELEAAGIRMAEVWNTNNDELVCDICGPLDQTVKGEAWTEPPPAHPNCRCWVGLEIVQNG